MRSCSAWTRRRRFRRSIGRNRCCQCARAKSSVGPTTTNATARPRCLRPSDLKTSKILSQLHRRHRSLEFRKFLDAIDAAVPAALAIHLIMDNYGTHKTALIRRWLAKRPRFHVHFTPTYGSWLNLVERWFAELTNKQVRRGVHRSVAELETAIRAFIDAHNADPKPFVWTKTADQILASIARFAQRTVDDHPAELMTRTTGTGH